MEKEEYDEMIKKLNESDMLGKEISIPYSVEVEFNCDDKGYLDRQCPSERCGFEFKVLLCDWEKSQIAFCPKCRHEEKKENRAWLTTLQNEVVDKHIVNKVGMVLQEKVESELDKIYKEKGFVSFPYELTSADSNSRLVPAEAKKSLELEIECEKCQTHYAVIGSAFFCPKCGHNSVENMIDDFLKKINAKSLALSLIREQMPPDEAERTCQHLIESGVTDSVVAFQKIMECLYLDFTGKTASTLKLNVFQRLEDGGKLWKQTRINQDYTEMLSNEEFRNLNTFFQQRHLLSHTDGIVNDKYINNSGDITYKAGQRLVITEPDVLQMTSLLQKIVSHIKTEIATI
jgi:hypothetical protein